MHFSIYLEQNSSSLCKITFINLNKHTQKEFHSNIIINECNFQVNVKGHIYDTIQKKNEN